MYQAFLINKPTIKKYIPPQNLKQGVSFISNVNIYNSIPFPHLGNF